MAKPADALGSGPSPNFWGGGSSPLPGTSIKLSEILPDKIGRCRQQYNYQKKFEANRNRQENVHPSLRISQKRKK